MCVQNILDRNRAEVVTIPPTNTVKSAADRMRAHDIVALVVKSGAAITGLISGREIVHAASRCMERALSVWRFWRLCPIPRSQLPRTVP